MNGANDRDRTDDLFITNELLYQLSYIGTNETPLEADAESSAFFPSRQANYPGKECVAHVAKHSL